MKKSFLCLLVSFCATCVGFSQLPKTLLWEISGKGLAKPSYLYGTIHVICAEDLKISENLKTRLKNTQQLYLEMDIDDPILMAQLMLQKDMKDGKTLQSLFSESDYKLVQTYIQNKIGSTASEFFRTTKPFLLMSLLLPSTLGCQTASWETSLMTLAQEQHMEILGLETLDEQLQVVEKIPYEAQAKMLLETIKDSTQAKKELLTLIDLYKKQDINAMQKQIAASPSTASYEKILLTDRNQHWTLQIKKIVHEKSTFFAVGAGHLGGKQGLVALLRKDGYMVRPVSL